MSIFEATRQRPLGLSNRNRGGRYPLGLSSLCFSARSLNYEDILQLTGNVPITRHANDGEAIYRLALAPFCFFDLGVSSPRSRM